MKHGTKRLIRGMVWASILGLILTHYWMLISLWLLVMETQWWKEAWRDDDN